MNRTQGKQTNYIRIFLFTALVVLSIFTNHSFSQENQVPFEYQKTVWIFHSIDGAGIVYGLPDYYEPTSAFIIIRNLLMKYVYVLEDFPTSTSAKDLAPEYVLILMNNVNEQQLMIGKNWISDGKKIALMEEADFNALKAVLVAREKNEHPPYSKHPIDPLLRTFRKGMQDNPEESEYRLKIFQEGASQKSLKITDSRPSANSSFSSSSQEHYTRSGNNSSMDKLMINDSENIASSNSAALAQSSTAIKMSLQNDKNNHEFIIRLAGVLLVACVCVVLFNRKKK